MGVNAGSCGKDGSFQTEFNHLGVRSIVVVGDLLKIADEVDATTDRP